MDGRTDRRTDTEGYNIIPRHTLVAGYKNSFRNTISFKFSVVSDLSPNCLQRLSVDDKSRHQQGKC